MTSYNERLDEILERYRLFANMAYSEVEDGLRTADEFKDVALPKVLDEAKQAILRWVADEVIGTDYPYFSEASHSKTWGNGKRSPTAKAIMNHLKDEQRKILAQHGYKGDQR